MRKQTFLVLFVIIGLTACAPSERALVRKGNNKFEAEKYGEAELKYKESLSASEENDLLAAKYNLGNAYYKQERLEEAVMQYDQVIKSAEEDYDKAIAHHNKGNGFLHQYNFMNSMLDDLAGLGMDTETFAVGGEEINSAEMLVHTLNSSIESYKDALRKNPGDYDSQYNLAVAQMLLRQYQKEEEQKSQCDNPKDSDENEEKKEEEEKEEEKENEEKSEEEKEEEKEQEEQDQSEEEQNQEKEGEEESEGEKSEEEKSEEEKSQEKGEEGEESEEEKEKSDSGEEGEEDGEKKEGQPGQEGDEKEEQKSAEQTKQDSLLNQMPRKMSTEEVERLLEALKNEELKVQEKLHGKKGKGRRIKTEKDW